MKFAFIYKFSISSSNCILLDYRIYCLRWKVSSKREIEQRYEEAQIQMAHYERALRELRQLLHIKEIVEPGERF